MKFDISHALVDNSLFLLKDPEAYYVTLFSETYRFRTCKKSLKFLVVAASTTYLNLVQVLATSTRQLAEVNSDTGDYADSDSQLNFGEDDENMVSGSKGNPVQGYAYEASKSHVSPSRDKHLRYRTRVFAAE